MTPDRASGAAAAVRDFGPAPKPNITRVSQTDPHLYAEPGEAGYGADAFRNEGDAWEAVARNPGRTFGPGRRRASA